LQTQAALESKDKEHLVELQKKDKKLAQLKELAMAKATEKLKERDGVILRLKKEKLRMSQEREEELSSVVKQHRAETEELNKQLKAKTEALLVMRGMVADLEKDENAASDVKPKKDTLIKLHANYN
jgi:hypothetical protein